MSRRPESENAGRRLKIIFVNMHFDPEPGIQRGLPLARWLVQQGHEVKVITGIPHYPQGRFYPGYKLKLRQWETMDGVRVLRVPLYPSHDTSSLKRILTYLSFAVSASVLGVPAIGKADVVYLYHPPPTNGLASLMLKWFRRLPVVYHIADMWPESVLESGMVKAGLKRRIIEKGINGWLKRMYAHADIITVLSPGFRRLLMERGVPDSKIRVIYNWSDEDIFRPQPRDEELAKELGFAGRFNVVYGGNLGMVQGLEAVIRAASLLKDLPDVQIVFIGAGANGKALEDLAKELGADNVRFAGPQPHDRMGKVNAISDVLLIHLKDIPFLATTIPGKTQVSLCSGRPILIGVRGDAADVVERAGGGIACEPESPESIAAGIRKLYAMSPEERERMGRSGHEFYMSNMSLDISCRQMEEIFEELAGTRSPVTEDAAGTALATETR